MDSNTTSNMLHTYLDGELDQTHEKHLFEELAQSQDLRSEMRDLLAIRAAVHHDVEAFSPPIVATNNVFSTLGFTMPASAPVASQFTGMATGAASSVAITSWWSRLWLPVTTLLLGAGVTYFLLNWWYSNSLALQESEYKIQIQQIRNESEKEIDEAKRSAASTKSAEPQVLIKKVYYPVVQYKKIQGVAQSMPLLQPNTKIEENFVAETRNAPILNANELQSTNSTDVFGSASNTTNSKSLYFAESIPSPSQTQSTKIGENAEEFLPSETPEIWIKFSQNTASISSTITTNLQPQEAFLNNFNGELGWMLSPSLSLGVKVGREAFPMSYYGVTNGRTSRYEQYSALLWGGISADLRPSELSFFGGIQPYFSAVAGGSELGPLLRGETGLLFQVSSQVGLSAGTNATGMFYQYQSTNFYTWKFGITTGITFQF